MPTSSALNRNAIYCCAIVFLMLSCDQGNEETRILEVERIHFGSQTHVVPIPSSISDIGVDQSIVLEFSHELDPASLDNSIEVFPAQPSGYSTTLRDNGTTLVIRPSTTWQSNTKYSITLSSELQSRQGQHFVGLSFDFITSIGIVSIKHITIDGITVSTAEAFQNASLSPHLSITFSAPLDPQTLSSNLRLNNQAINSYALKSGDSVLSISMEALDDLTKYSIQITDKIQGRNKETFSGKSIEFYTLPSSQPKFPILTQDQLLTKIQQHTFWYFWDFAHPVSGMIRERNSSGDLVTTGGTGFGLLAILVGIERGFISTSEGIQRIAQMVAFLKKADRFHGAWAHWMNGVTGKVIPFSAKDNGADLVETAFLIQGMLSVRSYLIQKEPEESELIQEITKLWEEVEWTWFMKDGQKQLYWHWSPDMEWQINLPITGYNEALIVYVLAAASPTFGITKEVYDEGWARGGSLTNGKRYYDIPLPLGGDYGGPLFFSHYSFQCLDPRNLSDSYAHYWQQCVNHSMINQAYCIHNPKKYVAYFDSCWGLTASDNHRGYSAHSPTNDLGVITPSAAIGSLPYTPEASLSAIHFFYYKLGDRLWGDYGFHDAFNITEQWYASSYLAIDQGPIINMIENYRTGLLWELFMSDAEIQKGLTALGFNF